MNSLFQTHQRTAKWVNKACLERCPPWINKQHGNRDRVLRVSTLPFGGGEVWSSPTPTCTPEESIISPRVLKVILARHTTHKLHALHVLTGEETRMEYGHRIIRTEMKRGRDAIMNAWNLLYSYLYVPQRYIAVSFNKCTFCKSRWIKASAECPKCKCKCNVDVDSIILIHVQYEIY